MNTNMKTNIAINCNINLNLNVFWALGRLKASKAIFQTLLCLGNLGPLLTPYWLLLAPIDPRRWGQVGGPGVRGLWMPKDPVHGSWSMDHANIMFHGTWSVYHGPLPFWLLGLVPGPTLELCIK